MIMQEKRKRIAVLENDRHECVSFDLRCLGQAVEGVRYTVLLMVNFSWEKLHGKEDIRDGLGRDNMGMQ